MTQFILHSPHISNTQAVNQAFLSSDITQYASNSTSAVATLTHALQGMGYNLDSAHAVCYKLLSNEVFQQSSLLSYLSSFRVLAVVCIVSLPFMFLLKKHKTISK